MNAKDKIKLVDAIDVSKVKIDKKCKKCTQSICCSSINQKIPTPKTKEDFDHLLWQVSHENINVFKDSDGWFLHIYTPCSHLLPGGICSIYENRPWVCREYTNDFCEYDESIKDASELWFSTHKKLENTVANALRNGHAASNSTNRATVLQTATLGLLLTVMLATQELSAQETNLNQRIQSATDTLAELDLKAKTCLDNLDQGFTDQAVTSCDDFIQSVDGEMLAGYLAHCDALKIWREEFVTGESADTQDAETNLELLRGIELACGEGALQKRTEYVVDAFTLLQGGSAQNQASSAINRRVSEFELQQTMNAQRQQLQNSLLRQQQRTNQDTNRQWDDLQEELIRQQINRPPFPGN